MRERFIFFIDDNMIGELQQARELFRALQPLHIKWVSQASINVAHDAELLRLMADSGCIGLLIGFESLDDANLAAMGKRVNRIDEYHEALARLRAAGIVPSTAPSSSAIRTTRRRVLPRRCALPVKNASFSPRSTTWCLSRAHRCTGKCWSAAFRYPCWWPSDEYRFGQVPFHPRGMTAVEVERHCLAARMAFYRSGSILQRGLDLRANSASLRKVSTFYGLNWLLSAR